MGSECTIVLGMHRSGTSALSGVLAKAGIDFGSRLLLAGAEENPKGFWEHSDIVALHDKLLHSLGSAWDNIDPLKEAWWEKSFLSTFRHDLREILKRDFTHVTHWGVKDPRLCRLLPFWQRVLKETGYRTRHVLILRHPMEVARSLHIRNGISELRASMLWLEYTLAAERYSRGLPRVLLRYEDLLSDWRLAISPLLKDPDYGLQLTPDTEMEIDAFLDHHLRHHREHDIKSPASTPLRLSQELYEQLPSLLRDGQVEEMFATTAKQLEQYRQEMAPWLDCLRSDLKNCQRKLDSSHREFNHQIDDLERENTRIKSSLTWKMGSPLRLAQNLIQSPEQTLNEIVTRIKVTPQEYGQSLIEKPSVEITSIVPTLVQVEIPPSSELLNTLAFPYRASPLVSIIVPVFNRLHLTLECLLSLIHCTSSHDFEVIVIDDASLDDTPDVLQHIHGLRYIRNPSNLGYIETCNRAAAEAFGRYLVFLDNDTQVQPGWLDALLAVFEQHPETGIAGSKLLNTDGSLQEAGAELTAEAFTISRGEGGAPDKDAYNTFQEVTYVSATSLMIKTSIFYALGGFDDVYSPAYYCDADLAMRVRQAGYRIYYQPESVAVHRRTTTRQIPASEANMSLGSRLIFLARWEDKLLLHNATSGSEMP
ncbi:glycosyltransferase [Sulfurirhabdus autotrophica]|uniref:Glycosyltransferase 2-like domain-containing protein n=1 Tax=Sulfurirhabdus autotrophica TaxID=1706046 RepID=A0A4R3XRI9_9PROT|nr:glycosyltransferase [Sulfurirhabdus autotrophica]TCV79104.1 hypothetical protein EDC63_13611 [Sulfurirhabdus autotrophica]